MKSDKITASDPIQNDREPRTEFVYFIPCTKQFYDDLDKKTKRGFIENAIEHGFDGMSFISDGGSGHTRTYTIEELLESLDDTTKNAIKVIKTLQFAYETEPQPYEPPEGVVPKPDPRISFEPFHLKDEKREKRMAKEKRERHFLKRYLERRKKELMGMMNEKIEQLYAIGSSTYESIKEYIDVIARIDEVRRVIEVCEERGRF